MWVLQLLWFLHPVWVLFFSRLVCLNPKYENQKTYSASLVLCKHGGSYLLDSTKRFWPLSSKTMKTLQIDRPDPENHWLLQSIKVQYKNTRLHLPDFCTKSIGKNWFVWGLSHPGFREESSMRIYIYIYIYSISLKQKTLPSFALGVCCLCCVCVC